MDNTRPTPLIDDIDGTRKKLESWISSQRGHEVSIPQLSIPEATGMSNVTLLFDITWQEKGQTNSESVVARLQPSIDRPVFPDYDMTLQYEVMDVVGRNSDIPVPQLRGLETDESVLGVQFYLMKRSEGLIPTDMPPYNMDGGGIDQGPPAFEEIVFFQHPAFEKTAPTTPPAPRSDPAEGAWRD